MPLKFPAPPQGSIDELNKNLRVRSISDDLEAMTPLSFGIAASEGGASPGLPHQVYSLGLDELANGKGLDDATPVSWRYFVPVSAPAVTSAEVNLDATGGHSFAQVNTGPFNEGTLATISSVTSDPQVAQKPFDVRLLRIPALYVTALWLKSDSAGSDLVAPIPPVISGLIAGKLYGAREFEAILQEAARKKSEPNNRQRTR